MPTPRNDGSPSSVCSDLPLLGPALLFLLCCSVVLFAPPLQLMNGHIWVESNGKAGGATYKFLVMLKLDQEGDSGDEVEEDSHDINFFALRVREDGPRHQPQGQPGIFVDWGQCRVPELFHIDRLCISLGGWHLLRDLTGRSL